MDCSSEDDEEDLCKAISAEYDALVLPMWDEE